MKKYILTIFVTLLTVSILTGCAQHRILPKQTNAPAQSSEPVSNQTATSGAFPQTPLRRMQS